MSDFTCEVVRVGPVTKHPNADKLSCTTVFGQNVIIKTGDLNEVEVYPGEVEVYKAGIIDISPWNHPLPRETI